MEKIRTIYFIGEQLPIFTFVKRFIIYSEKFLLWLISQVLNKLLRYYPWLCWFVELQHRHQVKCRTKKWLMLIFIKIDKLVKDYCTLYTTIKPVLTEIRTIRNKSKRTFNLGKQTPELNELISNPRVRAWIHWEQTRHIHLKIREKFCISPKNVLVSLRLALNARYAHNRKSRIRSWGDWFEKDFTVYHQFVF